MLFFDALFMCMSAEPDGQPRSLSQDITTLCAAWLDEELEVSSAGGGLRVRRRTPFGHRPEGADALPPDQAALAASEALGAGRFFTAMLLPAEPSCAPAFALQVLVPMGKEQKHQILASAA